ncbi:DUF6888 family protein [Chlorogloea sp. CCALA 695]|uniref:DUF6888 family protein n=1 Tax=Chlorogloea sp. CCALA 695 TaxID=2107693 RepID=UPI000D067F63|nr:hypothetical protein [Chlorogloea sp. CCALA 695]PSB32270.1 hypothetical protein C7B70_10925 [Chlorogloea sp. CCALA 695]
MIKPSPQQLLALFQDSVFLSEALKSIHLVRIDERTNKVVILAGDSIQIEISQNGRREIR